MLRSTRCNILSGKGLRIHRMSATYSIQGQIFKSLEEFPSRLIYSFSARWWLVVCPFADYECYRREIIEIALPVIYTHFYYTHRKIHAMINSNIYMGDTQGPLNEGMPTHRHPLEKGLMVIHFDLKFPDENGMRPENLGPSETLLASQRMWVCA